MTAQFNDDHEESTELDAEAEREVAEFVRCGHQVLDTIAAYYRSLRRRPVAPTGRLYPLRGTCEARADSPACGEHSASASASARVGPLAPAPAPAPAVSSTATTTTARLTAKSSHMDERQRNTSEPDEESSFEVKPGYLARLLPAEAPASPEPFEHLMRDFESLILPGVRAHTRTVHSNSQSHTHTDR